MKKQFITLVMLLFVTVSGFSQFSLNVTVPSATDACWAYGNFNSWNASSTQLSYVSTSGDGTTKLFTLNLPLSFLNTGSFRIMSGPYSWAQQTDAQFAAATTGTSQNVTVTGFASVYYYLTINVTVPIAVNECYFLADQVGWTLPTNAKQMTLVQTNADTKVFSYRLESQTNSTHTFNGVFYAGLDGALGTYKQKTPATNFTNPGTTNTVDFTVTEFKAIFVPVATALENNMKVEPKVRVLNKNIVAEGVLSTVSIFNISGTLIESSNTKGDFVSKDLIPGLYITRVDNKVSKQVVK